MPWILSPIIILFKGGCLWFGLKYANYWKPPTREELSISAYCRYQRERWMWNTTCQALAADTAHVLQCPGEEEMREIKLLEGAMLLPPSAICTRSSVACKEFLRWVGKAASQQAAELGSASRSKGGKVCVGIFLFVSLRIRTCKPATYTQE